MESAIVRLAVYYDWQEKQNWDQISDHTDDLIVLDVGTVESTFCAVVVKIIINLHRYTSCVQNLTNIIIVGKVLINNFLSVIRLILNIFCRQVFIFKLAYRSDKACHIGEILVNGSESDVRYRVDILKLIQDNFAYFF